MTTKTAKYPQKELTVRAELGLLQRAQNAFEAMTPEGRVRAFSNGSKINTQRNGHMTRNTETARATWVTP